MACKLPHEELNEIHKMLETKYSGEELEIAKAEAKDWYQAEKAKELESLEPEFESLKSPDELVKRFNERQNDMKGLGSENGYKAENERLAFEKQNLDLVNNPENMIEFMKSLYEIDDVQISDEHKARLEKVVTMIAGVGKNFIPETAVYLNTEASRNGGFIKFEGINKGIYIGVGGKASDRTQMSAAEAYVHELVHAATEYAKHNRKSEVAMTILRLQQLREDAMKTLTIEDFLPDKMQYNSKDEYLAAKKTYEYLTDPKVGLSEFIAIGMTNEKLIKHLEGVKAYRDSEAKEKGFFNALYGMVEKLFRAVMLRARSESREIKGDELLAKLMMELARANNKAMIAKKAGMASKIGDTYMYMNDSISKFLKKFTDVEFDFEKPPLSAGKIANFKWFAKNIFKLLTDERSRPHVENMLSESFGRRAEGFTQTLIRDFREKDSMQRVMQSLGLESGSIDRVREHEAQLVGSLVVNGFKTKPTKEQQEAMTLAMLDTDLSSIFENYGIEKIKKILESPEALDAEIKKVRLKVWNSTDKATGNYYVSQASGLGFYMATHKGGKDSIAQQLNARAIANKANTSEPIEADHKIIDLIDTLATLEALSYTSGSQIDIAREMMINDPVGVRNFLALHKSFKEKSRRELFKKTGKDGKIIDGSFNEIKGYTKEIFDSDVSIEIAPISKRTELESQGYEYVESLVKHNNDGSKSEMALFINDDRLTQSYNRTAMRLTDMGRKGTTLLDARYKGDESLAYKLAMADVKKINRDAAKIIQSQMLKPTLDRSTDIDYNALSAKVDEVSVIPVYDDSGVAINYRYMMSKKKKRDLLKQDIRAAHVLGRMEASIKDKIETKKLNDKILDVLIADAKENNKANKDLGSNMKKYYFIGPDSPNEQTQEAWRILPSEVKNKIISEIEKKMMAEADKRGVKLKRNKKGKFVVDDDKPEPKWLLDIRNGLPFRADLTYPIFGFRDYSIADAKLLSRLPTAVKHVIRMAEMLWKEVVVIAKTSVIIKTPIVFIENVISNFALCVQLGINPIDVARLQMDGFRSLKKYLEDENELEKLKLARDAGNIGKMKIERISELENNLKENPVRELFESGQYSSIVEDVNFGDIESNSKIVKKVEEKIENFPEFVKDGLDILFVTRRTKLYKMIMFGTQASDFVARYALIEGLKNQGKSSKEAMNTAKDAFIIYPDPDSELMQYLNDIGLVMFTKYLTRIQKVIGKGAMDYPLNFLLSLLGQNYIGDISDITDSSLFAKDFGNVIHNTGQTIMDAVWPSTVEYATAVYNKL